MTKSLTTALALALTAVPLALTAAVPRAHAQAPPAAGSVTAGAASLTVERAVTRALADQPAIAARMADYEAARARVEQALAALLPQVGAAWSLARTQGVATVGDRTITTWSTGHAVRGSASQLVYDFGKARAAVDGSARLAESAAEEAELQRQTTALAAREAFTGAVFAARVIRVSEQGVERARLNLRSAQGFYDVGSRPRSDVTRAEVDVANTRLDLIRARNAQRLALVALATVMGTPLAPGTELVDHLAPQPVAHDRALLHAEALAHRPELRQGRLRLAAAEASRRQADLGRWPDVTAGGYAGAVRTDLNPVWELSLALSWSLWDGGRLAGRQREAAAAVDGARARLRAIELDVHRDVEQAFLSVQDTQERIVAIQAALASARENFRLAEGRFAAGVGTILEVTDAQLALTLTQHGEAQVLADHRVALYRLERALGRRVPR